MAKIIAFRKSAYRSWEEVLDAFLLFRKALGNSPRTLGDYRQHVGFFFRSYPTVHDTESWGGIALRDSLLDHMGRFTAPVTFNLRLSSLRIFFEWAIKEGLLSQNPTEGLRKRKTSPRIVNIPKEVLTRLLELPDKTTFAGVRDYALFLLHLDTGIRPGEASNLLLSDFDMRAGTIEVRSTLSKTRTRRTLFLNRPTIKALTDYISVRPPEWEDLPIFCTWEGRPFTPYAWGQRIRDAYEERLGVRITPYMLRHAFALGFLRNEGNIFALQRIMGHTSLEMTRRYLALTDQDLKEAHAKASPLNNLLKAPPRKRLGRIKLE